MSPSVSLCSAQPGRRNPRRPLAARRGPMTRGDGTALLSVCWSSSQPWFQTLIDRPICLPQPDRLLTQAVTGKSPSSYRLTRGNLGGTAFSVLPAFIVLLVLVDHVPFSLRSCFLSSSLLSSGSSVQATSSGHQGASASQSIPAATFLTPRSARLRATRLVPYLTPSITATEEKRHGGQQQQMNSETAPHGKGEQGTWVFGVVFSPLSFLFFFFIFFPSRSSSRSLPVVFLWWGEGGWRRLTTAAYWGHTDDQDQAFRQKRNLPAPHNGNVR